jgi:phospholipid/cholesterol/gamma-HCH transport system substrate-binding protein
MSVNDASNKKAVIVGFFVLLGIIFLLAGILTIGSLKNTFARKVQLVTFFDDVGGLQKGGNIWFSGVKIGTVKNVKFYSRTRVRVILNVNESSKQYIRKDSRVKLSTDGLIGNKIIVIYGGSLKAEQVQAGDTLLADKTESQEEMLNVLQENNRNLLEITEDIKSISEKISKGKGSIGKLLEDEMIYNNLLASSVAVKRTAQNASSAAVSINEFSKRLNSKGTLVYDLMNDRVLYPSIKNSVLKIQKITDSVSMLVSDLKSATSASTTPLGVLLKDESAGKDLKNILKNLEKASKKLDEDLEALQHSFLLRRYFKKKEKLNNIR